WELVLALHEAEVQSGSHGSPDVISFNITADALGAAQWRKALGLLKEMRKWRIAASTATFNTLMTACAA
ncbi:unnamed protein product, partial [Effrenium voratum]